MLIVLDELKLPHSFGSAMFVTKQRFLTLKDRDADYPSLNERHDIAHLTECVFLPWFAIYKHCTPLECDHLETRTD